MVGSSATLRELRRDYRGTIALLHQCGMPATGERSPSRGWVIGIAISLGVVVASFGAIVVRLYGK